MGLWVKYFADGTKYAGDDSDPSTSWRRSRNEDIVAVELIHDGCLLKIEGPGEYWQSDLIEVVYPSGAPTYLERRIQKRIDAEDKFFTRYLAGKTICVSLRGVLTATSVEQIIPVRPSDIGKWMTLIYCPKSQLVTYSIRNDKL